MSIADATPAEIAAMRQRLRARQEARSFDAQAEEAIALVRSRRAETPVQEVQPAREIPPARKITFGWIAVSALNVILRNWLFEMVLGLAVFAAAVAV